MKFNEFKHLAEAQFGSKQEVIAHFVKQGKTAAAGAAAWERGYRGSAPKAKKPTGPVRNYHDDQDDKRYGETNETQGLDETSDIEDTPSVNIGQWSTPLHMNNRVSGKHIRPPSSVEVGREPTWSFMEIAEKLGITSKELIGVRNSIPGFPTPISGIKSSVGSKAYFRQSEVKRWVNDNDVRAFIKAKKGVTENIDALEDQLAEAAIGVEAKRAARAGSRPGRGHQVEERYTTVGDDHTTEGAKVDRMVKHIAKSEHDLGKSNDDAESIAWATANKRGYLDNKNKKKHVEEEFEEHFCEDCGGSLAEAGKASRALCVSSKSDAELGASQLSSCKSQGLRAREGKKSHLVGKDRVTVGGKKMKGKKYGGNIPDWS